MRILISAGEASGERYGAQLIGALRHRVPNVEFFGVGGERMRRSGCELVVDAREIAVVGIAEVVSSLPRIWRRFHDLLRTVDAKRPDVAVLIDFPDFNLRLAKQLHRRGIPVVYYVSPQVWAWRSRRVRQIQRYVHKMLVIFPFEQAWYNTRGVQAEFVGHPLADEPQPSITREEFATENLLDPNKQWIALLPGSRRKEIALNLPTMMAAANHLAYEYQLVMPVAHTIDREWLQRKLRKYRGENVRLVNDARAALKHARAAVVASGTATVEAALMGTPFVMVYRVSPLTWALGRRFVRVPHFAMVNLIAGERVVTELVQQEFTAENVVRELNQILPDGPNRSHMLERLAEVRRKLATAPSGISGQTAAGRAADIVLQVAGQRAALESSGA